MADATQGRLSEWTPLQRHQFNLYLARNYTVKQALANLAADHEELYEYNTQTLYSYRSSEQGKKEFKQALDEVRAEAKDKTFAHRGSRLDTLIEIGVKLLDTFRRTSDVRKMTWLSSELKDTLKEIRMEVDPLGLDNAAVASHFDKILTGFNSLDQKHRDMITGDNPWISTSETASN